MNATILIACAILFGILAPISAFAGDLTSVIVRGKDANVVKQLTSQQDLDEFSTLWSKKAPVSVTKRDWQFKINLEPGDTWLYDSAGWVRILSVKVSRDYQIPDSADFNKLLGIHNQAEERRLEAVRDE